MDKSGEYFVVFLHDILFSLLVVYHGHHAIEFLGFSL